MEMFSSHDSRIESMPSHINPSKMLDDYEKKVKELFDRQKDIQQRLDDESNLINPPQAFDNAKNDFDTSTKNQASKFYDELIKIDISSFNTDQKFRYYELLRQLTVIERKDLRKTPFRREYVNFYSNNLKHGTYALYGFGKEGILCLYKVAEILGNGIAFGTALAIEPEVGKQFYNNLDKTVSQIPFVLKTLNELGYSKLAIIVKDEVGKAIGNSIDSWIESYNSLSSLEKSAKIGELVAQIELIFFVLKNTIKISQLVAKVTKIPTSVVNTLRISSFFGTIDTTYRKVDDFYHDIEKIIQNLNYLRVGGQIEEKEYNDLVTEIIYGNLLYELSKNGNQYYKNKANELFIELKEKLKKLYKID